MQRLKSVSLLLPHLLVPHVGEGCEGAGEGSGGGEVGGQPRVALPQLRHAASEHSAALARHLQRREYLGSWSQHCVIYSSLDIFVYHLYLLTILIHFSLDIHYSFPHL